MSKSTRPLRDFEWELMKPQLRKGHAILELGNKKNALGVYKPWLMSQGYSHVSIDINGLDGALALDLRDNVPALLRERGLPTKYDMLTNSGVTEHVVTRQCDVWRNCYDLVKVGGVQVHITPAAGHWLKHGLFHPKEEFYRKMAELNGMEIVHLGEHRWTPGKVLTRAVLRKTHDDGFLYPGDGYLDRTPRCIAMQSGDPDWATKRFD